MKKILVKVASIFTLGMLMFTSCNDDKKLTVSSILYDTKNEWFVEAMQGMKNAAKDLNITVNEFDCDYDESIEKNFINEQIKNKPSAIVVCPLTTKGTGEVLSEATKLGIPVVTWNTVVEPLPTAQIVVDSTKLGSATGEYLCEYVKAHNITKLKAALIIDRSFSIGIARCDGFRKSIQPLINEGILGVVNETQGQMYEEIKVILKKILAEQPDINFIWCWHQMSTMATVDVLKELGRTDILVTGTDMSLALAEYLISDKVNLIAITTQQPYKMGYDAVTTAARAVNEFPAQKTIEIPVLTYTKENEAALKEYIDIHAKYVKK